MKYEMVHLNLLKMISPMIMEIFGMVRKIISLNILR